MSCSWDKSGPGVVKVKSGRTRLSIAIEQEHQASASAEAEKPLVTQPPEEEHIPDKPLMLAGPRQRLLPHGSHRTRRWRERMSSPAAPICSGNLSPSERNHNHKRR